MAEDETKVDGGARGKIEANEQQSQHLSRTQRLPSHYVYDKETILYC